MIDINKFKIKVSVNASPLLSYEYISPIEHLGSPIEHLGSSIVTDNLHIRNIIY
jgi:hypothetical protein